MPNDFYSLSIDELILILESKYIEHKKQLYMIQDLSTLLINGVSVVLNGKKAGKLLTIHNLHPELVQTEETEKTHSELDLHKARMDLFMRRVNKERGSSK